MLLDLLPKHWSKVLIEISTRSTILHRRLVVEPLFGKPLERGERQLLPLRHRVWITSGPLGFPTNLSSLVPVVMILSFIPDIAIGITGTFHATWGGVIALMTAHVVVAVAAVTSFATLLAVDGPSAD